MTVAVALVPFVVAIGGALMYALSSNGKVAEIGRLAMFCGLFWLVYLFAGATPIGARSLRGSGAFRASGVRLPRDSRVDATYRAG
jgi:hypothetical protein